MPSVPDPESLVDARSAAISLLKTEEGDLFSKAVVKYAMKEFPPAVGRMFEVSRHHCFIHQIRFGL